MSFHTMQKCGIILGCQNKKIDIIDESCSVCFQLGEAQSLTNTANLSETASFVETNTRQGERNVIGSQRIKNESLQGVDEPGALNVGIVTPNEISTKTCREVLLVGKVDKREF